MKKIMLLALMLIVAIGTAFSDSDGNFEFRASSDKKTGRYIVITKYVGKTSVCEIPETIGGYPVTEVSNAGKPIASKDKITALVLPKTLVEIGMRAFEDQNIKTVTIPSSVEKIGTDAFANSGIREFVILPRTKDLKLGAGCFKNNHLTKLNFPSNVDYFFDNDEAVLQMHTWSDSQAQSITLPNPVFSGNDFETFVIEPNWYGSTMLGDRKNYSGAIDYEDWRGKLQEVVYKDGCKSLSIIASQTVKFISIPKSIGLDSKGKPLKKYHHAEWCCPNMSVDGIKYEKGCNAHISARLKEKVTDLQKFKLSDDGVYVDNVKTMKEGTLWYFDKNTVDVPEGIF